MKVKILVWIDSSLTHFGISKSLKENFDCEIFAIIDTNQGREFFEKQEFIEFSKVWYFRDYFLDLQKNIDQNFLQEFEDKYRINLWEMALGDEILSKYNSFHKFTDNEILKIFESECKFFEKVLDEVKPDFLLIRITDTSNIQILHRLCIARGIKPLMLCPTRLGNRFLISEDLDKLDDVKYNNKYALQNKITTFEELRNFIHEHSTAHGEFLKKYRTSKKKLFLAAIEYLKLTFDKKYQQYYQNRSRTAIHGIIIGINFLLKRKYRHIFINKNFFKQLINKEPFVYFPLQLEPERSLQVTAPFYSDQIEVIRNIAKSLPIDYKLCIKEHPAQEMQGWHSIPYYKEILEMPNVEMYHPSVSNEEMIKKCSLVITISGTAGLEGVIFQKPVITFADTNYSEILSIHRIKNLEELPSTIQLMLQTKPELNDLKNYLTKIEANSFDFKIRELSIDTLLINPWKVTDAIVPEVLIAFNPDNWIGFVSTSPWSII